MARVISTGGILTLHDPTADGLPTPQAGLVNLHVRLFALVDSGLTAIDPRPQSFAWTSSQGPLPALEGLADKISSSLRDADLPSGHRQASWSRVVAELKGFGIETDPETLQALPFDAVPIGSILDLLER